MERYSLSVTQCILCFKKMCFVDKLMGFVLSDVTLYFYCWCFSILWNKLCILYSVWILIFMTLVFLNVVSVFYSGNILNLLCMNGAVLENVKSLGYCQPHDVCSLGVSGV